MRAIQPVFAQILVAKRETRLGMRISIRTAIILPLAFLVKGRWGTAGIAAAWIFAHPICIAPLSLGAMRLIELAPVDCFRTI